MPITYAILSMVRHALQNISNSVETLPFNLNDVPKMRQKVNIDKILNLK